LSATRRLATIRAALTGVTFRNAAPVSAMDDSFQIVAYGDEMMPAGNYEPILHIVRRVIFITAFQHFSE
jgi:hypothetical protein